MNLPTFPSLSSSMSTSPAPTTPPTHNSPSNQIVDPTTALIALMHQSLHQNATMIAQLNYCPSLQPAQQPSPSYQFKPQRPPLQNGTVYHQRPPLFLSKIVTYKAKAFYSRVHNWTCTTPTSQKLSVAVSSNILALLP